jgi:hypothetical protein
VITVVPNLSPRCLTFHKSYFLVSENNRTFTNSAPFDGYTWPGDEYTPEQVPDDIVAMVSDTRYLWVFGSESFELWDADGNPDGPFSPVTAAAGLVGAASRDSVVLLDNTFFFLGQTRNGNRMAYRASGFQVQRVSNHAIETEWQKYTVLSDAVAFGYQENGHTFWVISFPYEDKTWVYDVATTMWHERGFWNIPQAKFESVRGRYGAFGLGFQLVCDKADGRVYVQAMRFLDDDGNTIRRVRRTPHTFQQNRRMFFQRLELFQQVGIGAVSGNDAYPVVMLRWSNDGGFTWSNYYDAPAGPQGAYLQRTIWNRLGAGRDRVWEFSVTASVDWVFIDAELYAIEGYS